MLEKIKERVSVVTIYDREKGSTLPYQIKWNGKKYTVTKLGYHYKERVGRTVDHIFTVSNSYLSFKLRLETDSLIWYLEEVSDGLTN